MAAERSIVLVVGMHRSGTSALAGALTAAGYLGGTELLPPDNYNAKGYFEDAAVNRLNDAVLSAVDLHWWDAILDTAGIEWRGASHLVSEAIQLVEHFLAQGEKIFLKDPRFCITLPFWRHALSQAQIGLQTVFIHRDPHQIIRSLRRRDDVGEDHAAMLVMSYWLSALKNSGGRIDLAIDFEDLLRTPVEVVSKILRDLDDTGDFFEEGTLLGLEPSLVNASQAAPSHIEPLINDCLRSLYAEIQNLQFPGKPEFECSDRLVHDCNKILTTAALISKVSPPKWIPDQLPWGYANRFKIPLLEQVASLSRTLESVLASNAKEIGVLRADLAESATETERLEAAIREKVTQLEDIRVKKEARIEILERQIIEQDGIIHRNRKFIEEQLNRAMAIDYEKNALQAMLIDKEEAYDLLAKKLSAARAENLALRTSLSWRLTFGVRLIFAPIVRFLSAMSVERRVSNSRPDVHDVSDDREKLIFEEAPQDAKPLSEEMLESRSVGLFYSGDQPFRLHEQDWLIWCAFCPDNALSQLQEYQIDKYVAAGFSVLAVLNTDPVNFETEHLRADVSWLLRENVGFDFGAWRHVLQAIGGLHQSRSLSFTNDSILPIDEVKLSQLRESLHRDSEGVHFLTRNDEQRTHEQSYFFSIVGSCCASVLDLFTHFFKIYESKAAVIHNLELNLGDQIRAANIPTFVKFPVAAERNPTIWNWEELVAKDFPFIKINACVARSLRPSDMLVFGDFGYELDGMLKQHLDAREESPESRPEPHMDLAYCTTSSTNTAAITGELKVREAVNVDGPIASPLVLDKIKLPASDSDYFAACKKTVAVIHCFYEEESQLILKRLSEFNIPFGKLLLVTTSEAKSEALKSLLSDFQLVADVVVTENRGRNVGPLFDCLKSLPDGYEFLLHLHTKRSPHNGELSGWGEFLIENLLSSQNSIMNILHLLSVYQIGMVYSAHHPEVRDLRSWGLNYSLSKDLLEAARLQLNSAAPLEFPTGMMFWARIEIFDDLLSSETRLDSFPSEDGQVDGTLAHAIERTILHCCEAAMRPFVSVISEANVDSYHGDVRFISGPIPYLKRFRFPSLFSAISSASASIKVPELVDCTFGGARDAKPKKRVNLVIPTVTPEKIFGGVTSALNLFSQLLTLLEEKEFEVRLLVTSDKVGKSELDAVSRICGKPTIKGPTMTGGGAWEVLSLLPKPTGKLILDVGPEDYFMATAWWTAELAQRIQHFQSEVYNLQRQFVYFIQDYEPGFYEWGVKASIAYSTYLERERRFLGIVNSEELHKFFEREFGAGFDCLPYQPNKELSSAITPTKKQRQILVYTRPSTPRNLFSNIVSAIEDFQSRAPDLAARYSVVCVGESFDESFMQNIDNYEILGKLSIQAYAEQLSISAVGVSLMMSPHPSYPPLEMAAAGCMTVTNNFATKDMRTRSKNFYIAKDLSPTAISNSIEAAIVGFEKGNPAETRSARLNVAEFRAEAVLRPLATRWISA